MQNFKNLDTPKNLKCLFSLSQVQQLKFNLKTL